jgi:hypothetical protein
MRTIFKNLMQFSEPRVFKVETCFFKKIANFENKGQQSAPQTLLQGLIFQRSVQLRCALLKHL